MKPLLNPLFALSFGLATVATTQTASAQGLTSFVENNVIHTMFHEIGHAIIDQFELPVIGQEEDAVDAFATIEVVNIYFEDAQPILMDVAASWLYMDAQTDREDLDFYDIHDLDAQRAYRTICHLYGLDPKNNKGAAEWAGLPEDTLETCEETAILAYDSWEAFLENGVLLAENEGQTIIEMTHEETSLTEVKALVEESNLLEDLRQYAQVNFAWPNPIEIRASECGESNAFWDPQELTVTLCYEIVQEWIDMEAKISDR